MAFTGTDLLLSECGDLYVENGDLALVTGTDCIKQLWLIHIRISLGEWFKDETIGLPYFQEILTKRISKARLKKIFTDESLKVPGILQVISVHDIEIDRELRKLSLTVDVIVEGDESATFRYTGVAC